ncbi:hypothetical protein Efla_000625 [Eimeria flavescens]
MLPAHLLSSLISCSLFDVLAFIRASGVRKRSLKEPQVADDQMHSGEEEADFHISRPLYDSHLMPLTSGLEGYAKPPESNFSSAEVDIEKLIRKGRRRNKRGAISTLKNLFRKPKLAKFLVIAIVLAVAYFFNDLLNSILRILFIGWLALKAVELLD